MGGGRWGSHGTQKRGGCYTSYGTAPSLALPSFSSWDIFHLGGLGGGEGRDGRRPGAGTPGV